MKRSGAIKAVSDYLRAGLLGARSPDWHPWLAWKIVIEVGDQHYVTSALAWCLRDKAYLPIHVRRHLDAVLILNGKRNQKLLKVLARVAAALNAIDIEPVLLKGAAYLVEGIYPAPGLRMLGDLDLLMREDRVKVSAEALQKIRIQVAGPALPENHHHWPVLVDPETGAAVELHMSALHRRSEHIMPSAEFHENARAMTFRRSKVRMRADTKRRT